MLPDDVLLDIFDFYVDDDSDDDFDEGTKKETEKWQTLVHVCRGWRSIVFGSSRRLNLQLMCTPGTPVRETLDVWPSLPLIIGDGGFVTEDVDEIIAALGRSDRVVKIDLHANNSKLENVLAEMQVPFPELTHLASGPMEWSQSFPIRSWVDLPLVSFLWLSRIPFPGLSKLLLSATHLADLRLENIPYSGYISPEAIVIVLSTLTSLEEFHLKFKSSRSRPDWANRRLPLPTRSVLPILTIFAFKGAHEYLEDLVALIDTPQLNRLYITLFNQIVFDTPQFIQFVCRSPTLGPFEKAHVVFGDNAAWVHVSSQTSINGRLVMKILCITLERQVLSIKRVCTSCLPPHSPFEDLYINEHPYLRPGWQHHVENTLWLGLLRPFTSVKNLYLSEETGSLIIPALQELTGGRTTEVLPILQNIFLEKLQPSGTVQTGVQQFISTRQDASYPMAVSCWDNSEYDMLENRGDLLY